MPRGEAPASPLIVSWRSGRLCRALCGRPNRDVDPESFELLDESSSLLLGGSVVRAAACAASVSAIRSHMDPWRVRPARRFPPEALLPGQIPAHDARCAEVGKALMSRPPSAINTSATRRPTPGMVITNPTTSTTGRSSTST